MNQTSLKWGLKHFAAQDPALLIDGLHVLSRKFTGVGSFTNFLCHGSAEVKWDRTVDLDATIVMPGNRRDSRSGQYRSMVPGWRGESG